MKLRILFTASLLAGALSLGAPAMADQCAANKSIDWAKTLASNPKTADLVYVAGITSVAAGQVGNTMLALIPLDFNASVGIQSLIIYRLTTAPPCAPPELLGSFKTDTTLFRSYFSDGALHLVTFKDQKESTMRHPTDFIDTTYHFENGKLVKVSSKETTTK
jgi:hypothetical protein